MYYRYCNTYEPFRQCVYDFPKFREPDGMINGQRSKWMNTNFELLLNIY